MRTALLTSTLASLSCMGQSLDSLTHRPLAWRRDEITLLAAYHQGRFGFAELCIGRNIYGAVHHPFGVGYHAGAELRVDQPSIVGWKVGAYATGGVAMGLQFIRYQKAAKGCTVIRPEIGIGVFKTRVSYAYNINLSPSRLDGISTHMVSLSHALRMKRLTKEGPQE
ncbi:MAG TPA: hypothetical protein PKY96_17200 [Flavobacteriales bacterium]|nr:hypothetical protein [Flavobacteriales bacterium]